MSELNEMWDNDQHNITQQYATENLLWYRKWEIDAVVNSCAQNDGIALPFQYYPTIVLVYYDV